MVLHPSETNDQHQIVYVSRETIDVATRSQASTDVCDFLKFGGKTCDFNATSVTILTYENIEPDEAGASGVKISND